MRATNTPLRVIPPAAPAGSDTNDIRGIKPPVEIASGWEWVWWTLGALVLAGALWWLWRWWRSRADAQVVIPSAPPHVRARQRLEAALRLIADPRLFCIEVSDALRVYLEERFDLRAPERTTEEFLQELNGAVQLNAAQKTCLADFLERCDLVKFARFEPTESALRELQESALRLVDETRHEPMAAPEATEGSPP
jgi:hypothetical protein